MNTNYNFLSMSRKRLFILALPSLMMRIGDNSDPLRSPLIIDLRTLSGVDGDGYWGKEILSGTLFGQKRPFPPSLTCFAGF